MGQKKYLNIDKLKLITALNKLARDVPDLKIEVGSKHTLKLSQYERAPLIPCADWAFEKAS